MRKNRKKQKKKVDPKVLKEIRKKYSRKLQERHCEILEKIENNKNWKLQRRSSTVELYRMNWEMAGVYIFKTVFNFKNVTVRQLYEHFYCHGGLYKGGEYIRVREPYLVQFRYVHEYDPMECITEQTCGYGVVFVSNREFVLFQTQRFRKGLITLAGESLEPEDADKVCGTGRLRGRMFFGHIFRQKGRDVESVVFTYTNPGLPVLLYNPGAQESAQITADNFIKQFDKSFVRPKTMSLEEKIKEVEDSELKEELMKLSSMSEQERERAFQKLEDEHEEEMMRIIERKIKKLKNHQHLYQKELKHVRENSRQSFDIISDKEYEAKSMMKPMEIKRRRKMKKAEISISQAQQKECCLIL